MRLKLSSIEMDTSIQCRASIDTATVSEYAERMTEGDAFPPVVVYGTAQKCWIADGWHRIMAANQIGLLDIEATVIPGGRIDALKAALSANSAHGIRRTNQDKRRAVEIALREFGKLSTAALSDLCGVSRPFVESLRPKDATVASLRTGADGKQYPATRRTSVTFAVPEPEEEDGLPIGNKSDETEAEDDETQSDEQAEDADAIEDNAPAHVAPKSKGVALDYAAQAIAAMQRIPPKDGLRRDAWQMVRAWLTANE